MMYIFKISQDKQCGYDTYSDAIVVAETMDEAANIHPGGGKIESCGEEDIWCSCSWCHDPKDVIVRLVGMAYDDQKKGVLCASFHAG